MARLDNLEIYTGATSTGVEPIITGITTGITGTYTNDTLPTAAAVNDMVIAASGTGASNFIELLDTPSVYGATQGFQVIVNPTHTGLIFATRPFEDGSGSGSIQGVSGANDAAGELSFAIGDGSTANGDFSVSEGNSETNGEYAHAEGYSTSADGNNSHSEGNGTQAIGGDSHSEGNSTIASGDYSHSEGFYTTASNIAAHAEGDGSQATGYAAHAEGYDTTSEASGSHSEGYQTYAQGAASHTGGQGGGGTTQVIAKGIASFNHQKVDSTVIGAEGNYSAILGGKNSETTIAAINSVVLGGDGITATAPSTVYVPNLNIGTLAAGTSVNPLGIDTNGKVIIGDAIPTSVTDLSDVTSAGSGAIITTGERSIVADAVTKSGAQTISGAKTFSDDIVANGGITQGGVTTKEITFSIGDWDMVAHPSNSTSLPAFTFSSIIDISAVVRNDSNDKWNPAGTGFDAAPFSVRLELWVYGMSTTSVTLGRDTGGTFNSTDYDSTSYNRGYITIKYIA